jgi:GMP synthase (glutamine-hydrolysing)
MSERPDTIIILDFGSQYTQLIARRLREIQVYCEIHPFNYPLEKLKALSPKGLIFSGSPSSFYEAGSPAPARELFNLGIPILGICYGMQAVGEMFGGKVEKAPRREYGPVDIKILTDSPLFAEMKQEARVWMSHGDHLTAIPPDFIHTASADNAKFAAIEYPEQRIYLVQFHPEVTHTPDGAQIIRNFARRICAVKGGWTTEYFIRRAEKMISQRLKGSKALCALSGGVDSTVTSVLMHRAAPQQTLSIFIDNGLLRFEDRKVVEDFLSGKMGLNLKIVEAQDKFLHALKGVTDPESKRKIIGETFIRIFESSAKEWGQAKFLAQGTLYPDVIESVSVRGPSVTIKSHHNVGGLPQVMGLELIEPLKELFKDEVREVGRHLGLPEAIIRRHPFPGPGLGVRILGEVTDERLNILRQADAIFISELHRSGWYDKVSQALCVLLPVKSVGVMGDARTYEYVLALRSVNTEDFMTASWSNLPYKLLEKISNRIINEVKGVNRVVYDVSTKPPSTVEWE